MAGRRFTTLVTLFEPFPSQKLLAFMQEFAARRRPPDLVRPAAARDV